MTDPLNLAPTRTERARHAVMRVVVEAVLITVATPVAVVSAWWPKRSA